MEEIKEGDPPTIIIGGPKRIGKSMLSIKLCEAIVESCHDMKYAYRDKGMPTQSRYDLRDAKFDPTVQVLYSLKSIPHLLSPPPPLGDGLPYGSPIISDESSINLSVLSFNNPVVKTIAAAHDACGFRIVPWLLNVPGSVLRVAYQFRETAGYFIQMKARGVGKVYAANPSVTGKVFLKTKGWLGYQDPFTKKIIARISVPSEKNMRLYNIVKDLYFRKQLAVSERRLSELSEAGQLGPYDLEEDGLASVVGDIELANKRKLLIPKHHDDDVD